MERIKGLLVDDEVNILNNLRTIIPWEDLGIDIIGMAKNGEKALEIFYEYHPEFILCDIRMPGVDGTEFIKKVKDANAKSEIVMLTGYKDFEYMRSSIQSGVRDYLLKPTNYEELQDIAEQVASEIKMRQLKDVMEKKKWGNISHLAYEKSLHDALMGYIPASPWLWEDRQIESMVYQLLVVDMDQYSQKARFWNDDDRRLWNFAIKNVLSEALQPFGLSYTVLQMREGEWCVLIESNRHAIPSLRKWADKLVNDVNQHLKLPVSVGGFRAHVSIDQMSRAYKMVQRDLHLAPNKHEENLILTDDVSEKGSHFDYFLWDKIEMIVSGLKKGDPEQSKQALINLMKDLQSVSEQSLVHVEQILHYLSLHLLREMKELALIKDSEEESVWKDLQHCTGNEDVMYVIQQLVSDSMEAMSAKKNSETLMIAAEDFIQRNMGEDIGLDDVAGHLEISSSYFSLLFKRHFDETFVEYLTRQRMEKAEALMKTTNLSITKIAKQLGYSDRRYFTKVFHKYAGMIPSEYRQQPQNG